MSPSKLTEYLSEEVAEDLLLEAQLVALTFAVGVNDAATFTDFHTFVSNQTGSTVLLAVGALDIVKDVINLNHVGLSLGGFLSGCLISGPMTLMVYIAAALRRWYVQTVKDPRAYAVIFLLAFSAGSQISMARSVNIAELPTGMITVGYTDLFSDPDILSVHNRRRNRRFCSVSSMLVGAFVGSIALKYEGPALSILLVAVVKTVVTLAFFLNKPASKPKPWVTGETKSEKLGV